MRNLQVKCYCNVALLWLGILSTLSTLNITSGLGKVYIAVTVLFHFDIAWVTELILGR